ncbi:MAG TPA: CDP-archaeol synthase [Candidatus Dormibacteraeota bacterium]|nr:CDP-archaeol synthase [Candidatus Dormibacteraeota bacterium]
MLKDLIFSIWFFLPAGLANASPIYAVKIPGLKKLGYPLDFNRKFRGKLVFGKNKTWRGLILAIMVGIVMITIQHYIYIHSSWVRSISKPLDYQNINFILLGTLLGAGAILGDAIESFAKRRLDIKPGSSWFPYDQIDYIFGGCLLSWFVIRLSIQEYLLILGVWFVIHIVSSYIGYLTGMKDRPI